MLAPVNADNRADAVTNNILYESEKCNTTTSEKPLSLKSSPSIKNKGKKYTYEETPDYGGMHVDARTAVMNVQELERVKEENASLSGMVDALKEHFQITKD